MIILVGMEMVQLHDYQMIKYKKFLIGILNYVLKTGEQYVLLSFFYHIKL